MGFDEAALSRVLEHYPRPAGWLLAFSGGLDSSVLLHALAALRPRLQLPLRAVHVHHGLLARADAWSRHCESACRQLNVPLKVVRLDLTVPPGESVEACAREARYAALAQQLESGEMLLTAQHQDDQAETLLLQLLRGAGIEGLAGMPACREWQDGWHARPLLDFSREHLHAWATMRGIDWVEDESNRDLRFDRNFLRHEVLPVVRRRWPAALRTIARSAGHLATSLNVLKEEAGADLEACREGESLHLARLFALSPSRRALVLRTWCTSQGYAVPDQRRMREIERQLAQAGRSASPRIDWAGVSLRRYRERLYLTPNPLPPVPTGTLPWDTAAPLVLPTGCGTLELQPRHRGVPARYWREGRVSLHWPEPGIRCRMPAREGSRALGKLCQEWGVPPWVRPYLPLVHVDQRLVAVAGHALCERFAEGEESLLWPEWSGLGAAGENRIADRGDAPTGQETGAGKG